MIFVALAWFGLVLLVWRMTPRQPPQLAMPEGTFPLVSIIVPARNEEANLPRLLRSLKALDYPQAEILVIDDCSTDQTAAVAVAGGARVVQGQTLPPGWKGKQWACWQGVQHAAGELLLFTDADTAHGVGSLSAAVRFLRAADADMVTALPFHDCITLWEKLLGPFHILLLALTAPYARPRRGRVFAIGQYLLTTKEGYTAIGGHEAVRSELVEDLPLANACLAAGRIFRVVPQQGLYRVRMYPTFGGFVQGWRRNFRAGLSASTGLAPLEMIAFAAALTGGGQLLAAPWVAPVPVLAVIFITWRQRRLGDFHWLGALLAPVSLAIFCLVTGLAVGDALLRRDLLWKGRAYSAVAGTGRMLRAAPDPRKEKTVPVASKHAAAPKTKGALIARS